MTSGADLGLGRKMERLESAKFYIRQKLGALRRQIIPVALSQGAEKRLHLGCGAIDHPGFTNIDGISYPHVHHVQRIDNLCRFKAGMFDQVYTSHTLEHFPREQTPNILREWLRVLRQGGCLTLSVPDFDSIVAIYQHAHRNIGAILPPLFGGQDYPFNFHYTAFNEMSLSGLLYEIGFSEVNKWTHGCDEFHDMPDWSGRYIDVDGERFQISLNLEAIK